MKKVIKFNDGQITVDLSSAKRIVVHGDLEDNITLLVIPGLPTNLAGSIKKTTTMARSHKE